MPMANQEYSKNATSLIAYDLGSEGMADPPSCECFMTDQIWDLGLWFFCWFIVQNGSLIQFLLSCYMAAGYNSGRNIGGLTQSFSDIGGLGGGT